MIISVHVPKTAGASFAKGLESRLGKRLLIDMAEDRPLGPSLYSWPSRWRGRIRVRSRVDELLGKYDAVHGHFMASKYFPLGDRAVFCIFFRDPTERILSQYRYALKSTSRHWYGRYKATLLSPLQYASLPRHQRLYALMTSGLPLERFAFVGITEEYEASLTLFKAIFGIDVPYHRTNVNEEIPDKFSPQEKAALRTTQGANARIYNAARRRFDSLYRQWCS